MSVFQSLAEKIIREAIEEGKFDDLEGRGKPIDLEDHPHEDPDWRLAFSILKKNGYAPDWIEARQEIEKRFLTAKSNLDRSWEWYRDRHRAGETDDLSRAQWDKAMSRFKLEIEKLNRHISRLNLKAPSPRLHLKAIQDEVEIERVKGLE